MNWLAACPEIALAISAMALLLFGVMQRREPTFVCSIVSVAVCFCTAALVVRTPAAAAYGGLFVTDAFAEYAKLLILLATSACIVLSLDFNNRQSISRFEFPILMLLSAVGMMVMSSSGNLMTLYMGLELQSLAIYVLAAFARDDLRSSEAGLKYFVLSALASGLLLYESRLFTASLGQWTFSISQAHFRTVPPFQPG